MDAADPWLPRALGRVEERLAELASGHGAKVGEDASATLQAGGKRLRPLLVLLCAGPNAGDRSVASATAVELIHMATLVHDDVLDDAPVRRGQPTVLARSGRERATAVGDFLLSRAFAELAEVEDAEAISTLAAASTSLARGELAQREGAYDLSLSEQEYLRRCTLKTARLFEASCRVGRASTSQSGIAALAEFGSRIGLAFQLLDDVLDVLGPPERTGKAIGTDLLDGTVTLPLIWAREVDQSIASEGLESLDESSAARVCHQIAATGATDRVRARAGEEIEAAKTSLARAKLDPEDLRLFSLIADGVVERYS
jgi:geranylgeranyl pyrophosphate synthase